MCCTSIKPLTGHWSGTQPGWYWHGSQWWWPVCQLSPPQGWQSWSEPLTSDGSHWSLRPDGQWCSQWAEEEEEAAWEHISTRKDTNSKKIRHLNTENKQKKGEINATYIVWNGQLMRASLCRGIHPSWRNAKKPCECVDLMDYYKSTEITFPLSICPPTLEALVAMCNGEGALLHGQLVKFGELLKQWW